MAGMEKASIAAEVFNVCTGTLSSLLDLIAALSDAGGRELIVEHGPARVGDIRDSLGDAAEDMHCLVAENDSGNMIGIVHYLYHRVTWSASDRCYLEDLFVAETARGTGAGRALIEAVYAAADDRGSDQVYWLTQESNEQGRRLYDRVGRLTPFIKYRR
jgi:GNAT superfamily N-acetyltransferase